MTHSSSPKTPLFSRFLAWTPQRLFRYDALGALLTASILGLVLPQLAEAWSIPRRDLYALAGGVLLLFIYSFSLSLLRPRPWRIFLRILAGANFSYCLITMILLWHWRPEAAPVAHVYFIAEALLIAGIALMEWRYSYRGGHPREQRN